MAGTSSPPNAPPQLVKLVPNGELVLIELQGALEIDNAPSQGTVLGRLSFEPGREDRPVLMISHHRLEGKFVSLQKPLAVIEKKRQNDVEPSTPSRRALDSMRPTWARLNEDSDEAEDEPFSPTLTRKRTLPSTGQTTKRSKLDSSPPPRPKHSEEYDFSSSPIRSERDWTAAPQEDHTGDTATYYDVVCIIRRKILFPKRPEPIVRLDPPT